MVLEQLDKYLENKINLDPDPSSPPTLNPPHIQTSCLHCCMYSQHLMTVPGTQYALNTYLLNKWGKKRCMCININAKMIKLLEENRISLQLWEKQRCLKEGTKDTKHKGKKF